MGTCHDWQKLLDSFRQFRCSFTYESGDVPAAISSAVVTPYAAEFMQDVADRVATRIQLTTDCHGAYLNAVDGAFGLDVDYAQLVKQYGEDANPQGQEKKYSPGVCTGIKARRVTGRPDARYVSTSSVEKHNQSMRQHMGRFTRLTTAHSKNALNHLHMVSLYTVWYNFARINSAVRMSPAMAAGLSETLWDVADIVKLIEAMENQSAGKL